MSDAGWVLDIIKSRLPRTKQHAKGWQGFNAVCCHHRGERVDTRGRGNVLFTSSGFSYNCFNCGFRTAWEQGRQLSGKNKQFLQWLGFDSDEIKKIAFKCWQIASDKDNFSSQVQSEPEFVLEFDDVALPIGSKSFAFWRKNPTPEWQAVDRYVQGRELNISDHAMFWTPISGEWTFNQRVCLPIVYKKQTIGYIARSIVPGVKYVKETANNVNVLYNADCLNKPLRKFVCVVEGPFDAIGIDGVAILKNSISTEQAKWIMDSGKTPIVVPDRDRGSKTLIEQAIALGWHVSIPSYDYWEDGIKDVADAVKKYGSIYTLQSILESATNNKLAIVNLMKKFQG
jgi:hypothetical protein